MDTVSNGGLAAITTEVKVKTTPNTAKAKPKPNPVSTAGAAVKKPAPEGAMPSPVGPKSKRSAKRVARVFFRKEIDQDVLTDYMKNLNLSDAGPGGDDGPGSPGAGPVGSFDDMNLKPELLQGIKSKKLTEPAECQKNVIMPMIQGRDVICQAQSGKGKTAAFVISILQRLDPKDPMCKALVLAPTRELAEQILAEFEVIGKYMNVKCLPCIGGRKWSYKKNLRHAATGNFQIAVGTIGRIAHLLDPRQGEDDHGIPRPGGMNGDSIKMFVIDEADKMLMERSFRNDLKFILKTISATAQLIVTSATMPSVAFDHCNDVMRKPFKFLLRNEQLTLDGIQQFYIKVGNEEGKLATLNELYPYLKHVPGIVFCNTRDRAERVAKQMKAREHNIEGITGTMEQEIRNNTFKNFKEEQIPVLIASDLLGRGIDVDHVKCVVNFDLPDITNPQRVTAKEEYMHRIGRAGRYGKKGVALSFVTDREVNIKKIEILEEFYQTQIPELRATIGDLMNGLKSTQK